MSILRYPILICVQCHERVMLREFVFDCIQKISRPDQLPLPTYVLSMFMSVKYSNVSYFFLSVCAMIRMHSLLSGAVRGLILSTML